MQSFELTLPQGEHSALAANGDFCTEKLIMPTSMIAQNGVSFQQQTSIEVQGCPDTLKIDSHKIKKK